LLFDDSKDFDLDDVQSLDISDAVLSRIDVAVDAATARL
jgi:hypothetical protein